MYSVSGEKMCETHENLCSEVEVLDTTLDSSSHEMLCAEEETWSESRAGMMICFSCKKIDEIFLGNKKIVYTLNYSFIVGSFFNAEGSAHASIDGAVRILGKVVDVCFIFEVDTFLDAEGLGKVK